MSPLRRGAGRVGPPDDPGGPPTGAPADPPVSEPPRTYYDVRHETRTMGVGASSTIDGAVVPVVYGERVVPGLCALLARHTWLLYGVWVFCHGEINSSGGVTDIKINGEAIDDIDWVYGYTVHYGTASQTVDANLANKQFNGVAYADRWQEALPGWCYVVIRMQMIAQDGGADVPCIPGALNVTAKVKGRKVYDFRSTSWVNDSKNPILHAYDVETDSTVPWRGIDSGNVPTANWEEWADYCDEVISGDSSKRFEFSGALDIREDAKAALEVILDHCHAWIVEYGGKDYIVGDKLPKAITGIWSSSGTTFTEDSLSGTALSDLEAGDIVVTENQYLEVDTVTDNDHFETTTAASPAISSAKVRLIRNIHLDINEGHIVQPPTGRDYETLGLPDMVRVRYHNPSTLKEDRQDARDPDVVPTSTDTILEVRFPGCTSASQAERHGQIIRRVSAFEINTWVIHARGPAADLFPGDIFRLTAGDGTAATPVRVLRRVDQPDDVVTLELREFDFNAYGDDYAADDTPVVVDPSTTWDPPDPPTAASQYFGELGDWDGVSVIPNADDITGWVEDSGLVATWDAGQGETELEYQSTSAGNKLTYLDLGTSINAAARAVAHLGIRWEDNPDANVKVELQYRSGSGHGDATVRHTIVITPPSADEKWMRPVTEFEVSDYDYHELAIKITLLDTVSAYPKVSVKNIRLVRWGDLSTSTPNERPKSPEVASLALYERWSWTEHGSAASTVAAYELYTLKGTSALIHAFTSVAVGGTSVTQQFWNGKAGFSAGAIGLGIGGSANKDTGALMRAINPAGRSAAFPAPTQVFEADSAPRAVDYKVASGTDLLDTISGLNYDRKKYYPEDASEIAEPLWNDYWWEMRVQPASGDPFIPLVRKVFSDTAVIICDTVKTALEADYVGDPTSDFNDFEVGVRSRDSERFREGTFVGGVALSPSATDAYKHTPWSMIGNNAYEEGPGPTPFLHHGVSDGATQAKYAKLHTFPDYNNSDNRQKLRIVVLHGGTNAVDMVRDEIIIGNSGEATEARVRWSRFGEHTGDSGDGIVHVSVRRISNYDEIWIEAHDDYGHCSLAAYLTDYLGTTELVMDEMTWSTTAPTGGSETFSTDTDVPDVEFDTADKMIRVGGVDVAQLSSSIVVLGDTGNRVIIQGADVTETWEVYNGTGSSLTLGQVVYVSGDQSGTPSVSLADADAASTCAGDLLMIAETITDTSTGTAVRRGIVGGLSSLTINVPYYVSLTAGAYTSSIASHTTGDIARIIGRAISTTEMDFDPSPSFVELN